MVVTAPPRGANVINTKIGESNICNGLNFSRPRNCPTYTFHPYLPGGPSFVSGYVDAGSTARPRAGGELDKLANCKPRHPNIRRCAGGVGVGPAANRGRSISAWLCQGHWRFKFVGDDAGHRNDAEWPGSGKMGQVPRRGTQTGYEQGADGLIGVCRQDPQAWKKKLRLGAMTARGAKLSLAEIAKSNVFNGLNFSLPGNRPRQNSTHIRGDDAGFANFNWLAKFQGEGSIDTPEQLEKRCARSP